MATRVSRWLCALAPPSSLPLHAVAAAVVTHGVVLAAGFLTHEDHGIQGKMGQNMDGRIVAKRHSHRPVARTNNDLRAYIFFAVSMPLVVHPSFTSSPPIFCH